MDLKQLRERVKTERDNTGLGLAEVLTREEYLGLCWSFRKNRMYEAARSLEENKELKKIVRRHVEKYGNL